MTALLTKDFRRTCSGFGPQRRLRDSVRSKNRFACQPAAIRPNMMIASAQNHIQSIACQCRDDPRRSCPEFRFPILPNPVVTSGLPGSDGKTSLKITLPRAVLTSPRRRKQRQNQPDLKAPRQRHRSSHQTARPFQRINAWNTGRLLSAVPPIAPSRFSGSMFKDRKNTPTTK